MPGELHNVRISSGLHRAVAAGQTMNEDPFRANPQSHLDTPAWCVHFALPSSNYTLQRISASEARMNRPCLRRPQRAYPASESLHSSSRVETPLPKGGTETCSDSTQRKKVAARSPPPKPGRFDLEWLRPIDSDTHSTSLLGAKLRYRKDLHRRTRPRHEAHSKPYPPFRHHTRSAKPKGRCHTVLHKAKRSPDTSHQSLALIGSCACCSGSVGGRAGVEVGELKRMTLTVMSSRYLLLSGAGMASRPATRC
ncbi:hypothetical protein L1887_47140 [Cichorium endivia]|nr:hypothetical protein L1887_47140 [Cichorium endivia]